MGLVGLVRGAGGEHLPSGHRCLCHQLPFTLFSQV